MTSTEWIELARILAWPLVGLFTLVYVWRSDAIGKLLRISDAIKDLRERLKDLVEVEERLTQSTGAIKAVTTTINQIQEDFISVKADVESIRDNVDQRSETPYAESSISTNLGELTTLFSEMDNAWQSLTTTLQDRFGWFDGRRTGSEVYRFAHGNRKGARLTYEQAEEIARLHSTIKSYRRRQASLAEWLDRSARDEFVSACSDLVRQIRAL